LFLGNFGLKFQDDAIVPEFCPSGKGWDDAPEFLLIGFAKGMIIIHEERNHEKEHFRF